MPLTYSTDSSGRLHVGARLIIGLLPTFRIPRVPEERTYRLPPRFGYKPLYRVPARPRWAGQGELITPGYRHEAHIFSLAGVLERPHLVKIAAGGKNLITGQDVKDDFDGPQDFVVVPGQEYLGGLSGPDGVSQLVAIPQDPGYLLPASLGGKQAAGFELRVYAPPEGWRVDVPRDLAFFQRNALRGGGSRPQLSGAQRAAIPAIEIGGRMKQEIAPLPDYVPLDVFAGSVPTVISIRTVNAAMVQRLTSIKPPPSPITRAEYMIHRIPYYPHYDVGRSREEVTAELLQAKSLAEQYAAAGMPIDDDGYNIVPEGLIHAFTEAPADLLR